ncbi:Uncharacterised protein [Mycobacteroides abscessus subsp. abscessus]|nr:Uncharacterised protein [Mycobacteroides abscessus subsp. abscessus]
MTFRFGSNRPKRLPTAMTAGTSVMATATATTMPTAVATPSVWYTGNRVKCRQRTAPAIVRPEPRTTLATLRKVA